MARFSIILALLAVGPVNVLARVLSSGKSFLGAAMQPEVVARTLRNVEDEWKAQAALFAQCNSTGTDRTSLVNCGDAPTSFAKSCSTVVNAVVQGSSGDKQVAKEYMADVCGQSLIQGWHQLKCQGLAVAISGAMSADTYVNRNTFNSNKLCTSFWSRFLKEEGQRIAEEAAKREAAEKKAEEEEKAAEEAAEKKAAEEAAQKKVEQAAQEREEAKAKAKEAAALAAQKKEEAAAVAEAAAQKLAEAKDAEQVHLKAMEKMHASQEKSPAETTAPKPAAEPKEANTAPTEAKAAVPVEAKAEPAAPVEVKNVKAAPAKLDAKTQAASVVANAKSTEVRPADTKAAAVKVNAKPKDAKAAVAPATIATKAASAKK